MAAYHSGFCDPPIPTHERHQFCHVDCTCPCHEGWPAMTTHGNLSSGRSVTDLTPPPPGPAPGSQNATSDEGAKPATPPDLETALSVLTGAAAMVNEAARPSTLPPWEEALEHLADLRGTVDILRQIDALLVQHIYLTGEHGKRVLDGIGEVWITRGRSKERWDERGVARAVVDAKMEERQGEVPDDPWEVAEWLLEVLGIGYVRKTALDAIGIPREPFYDSEPGTIQVTLPPPNGR